MTVRSLDGKSPRIDDTAFVSEAAYLVGDVDLGPQSSVWPGAVIRADSGKIVIGARSNVQDNSVIHADDDASIGNDVTIGHGVVCHSRSIGDGSLIGNGAVLNDGVEVGEGSLIAAGAVLPERMVVPAGSLVRGTPGRVLGQVRDRHRELMRGAAKSYVDRVGRYKEAGLES